MRPAHQWTNSLPRAPRSYRLGLSLPYHTGITGTACGLPWWEYSRYWPGSSSSSPVITSSSAGLAGISLDKISKSGVSFNLLLPSSSLIKRTRSGSCQHHKQNLVTYGVARKRQSRVHGHFLLSRVSLDDLKVMLHGTTKKDDFLRNTALQCWNNVGTIRNNVATMLQRCVALSIVVENRLV